MTGAKPPTRHLTDNQRAALATLFADCDPHEFLQCVAGLVAHNVGDYAAAMDAQAMIRKSAQIVKAASK